MVRLVDRYEIAQNPGAFVKAVRDPAVERVVVHSADWRREVVPQIYLTALAAATGSERWIADDHRNKLTRVPAGRAAIAWVCSVLGVPGEALRGLRQIYGFLRRPALSDDARVTRRQGNHILAIWSGDPTVAVGGSVSHTSGILQGFRSAGWRVTLICGVTPPGQIREAADETVIAEPVRTGARLTPELASLAGNRELHACATRAIANFGVPDLVYQRHAAFRTVGVELASEVGVPLVLEWNASEVWAFENWSHEAKPLRALTARLMRHVEVATARSADLVASVSAEAGRMATGAGARPERLIVSPNAAGIAEIDAATADIQPSEEPLVGWIGTFGSWHGAEVLIRSLALLPLAVRLRMIGEGRGRRDCERLAENLGLLDRIEWCGRIERSRALARLAECSVLACPTVELKDGAPFFGSPTKLFEYMALRRPIVASGLGQINDVLVDGETALLTRPGDHEELAQAIKRLLDDPTTGGELARAARVEVEEHHDWEQRARAILAALDAR